MAGGYGVPQHLPLHGITEQAGELRAAACLVSDCCGSLYNPHGLCCVPRCGVILCGSVTRSLQNAAQESLARLLGQLLSEACVHLQVISASTCGATQHPSSH